MSFLPADFLDVAHAPAIAILPGDQPVWEAIKTIEKTLLDLDWSAIEPPESVAEVSPRAFLGDRVRLGPGCVVEPGATIKGPAWFGDHCRIRGGAYVRENVIAGANVMLGNSSEFKNCILFDNVEAPHFNYIGDSILGYKAHLGAGAILSNVRLDRREIHVHPSGDAGRPLNTGLLKFGAIVGDHTEIGCNSVISPGSILSRNCVLYPGTHWRGVLAPDHTMVELRQEQILRPIAPRPPDNSD